MKNEFKLMLGDNLKSLKELPDNFVDSIVTDPPYGLSFMNKKWDYEVPSVEFWKEVYRVLKPGGHILSFGGTRTYHRMVVNIEDAGFEIRDQVMWIYSTGFPKSHNIGKSIQKISGDVEVIGTKKGAGTPGNTFINTDLKSEVNIIRIDNEYEGWGTALKPANEPICVARKPLSEKTIADNVLRWGTGGINIDGCRIDLNGDNTSRKLSGKNDGVFNCSKVVGSIDEKWKEGRFPANIIFDESAAELLDEQSGISQSKKRINPSTKKEGSLFSEVGFTNTGAGEYNDKGGASRFFYVAKVSKKERNLGLDDFEEKVSQLNSGGIGRKISVDKRLEDNGENATTMKNIHPTLKPINLMTYLCRLVTPVGGVVLDPFMGSGSTGISAMLEGFDFIGMEMDEEYFKIAEARIESFEEYRKLIK